MSAVPKPIRPTKAPSLAQASLFIPAEQRLLLRGVSWESYLVIGDALPDRPNLRMNYDGEDLELMTLSPEHEFYKARSSRLIDTLAEECDLKIVPGGSMTFRPETIQRGFEPDNCYWIAHEKHMRGRLS